MAFRSVDYNLGPVEPDPANSFALALAGGRLTATVVSKKTGKHITIALKAKRKEGRRFQLCTLGEAERIYIDTPRPEGPPTEIGQLHLAGKWAGKIMPPWEKDFDEARVWAARRVLDIAQGRASTDDEQAEILEGKTCLICARELTEPESIKRNIGPECWDKVTGLGSRGGQHQKPGEQIGFDVEEIHERAPSAEAAANEVIERERAAAATRKPMETTDPVGGSLTGKTYTEAEVIANDKRHADIEKIAAEEFEHLGEPAAYDEAVKVYAEREERGEVDDAEAFAKKIVEGSTREAIEAELQQSVVEGNADADLGQPEEERSDLVLVPADADPREILKGLDP